MSRAIQDLKDFLSKSPSVVFPDEVLEYVDAIENEDRDEVLNDLLAAMCEEIDSAEHDIIEYEYRGIDDVFEHFSDYAKLRGFVWGMRRAIFLLKYRAKNAGIEVGE